MADKKISALPSATTPLAGSEVLPVVQSGATDKVSVANLTAGRDVNAASFQVGTRLKINATHIADAAAPTGNDTGLAFSSRIYPCDSAGNLTNNTLSLGSSLYQFSSIHTGDNLVIGTAGKGIDFSANTHAAGMTSELLDWYEEGVWTPVISADGAGVTTFTATSAVGTYTRIGRQITIICEYAYSDRGAVGGSFAVLTGLPFARAGDGLEPVVFTAINQAAFDTRTFQANFAATSGIYFQYNNGEGTLYSGAPYMTGNDFPAAGTVRFVMSYFA